MQQITIVGHLGKDAIVKETGNTKLLVFSVCVTEKFENSKKESIEKSTWYACIGRQINVCQYMKKGDKILVQGELNAKTYTNDKEETSLDLTVNVAKIELLTKKQKDND